MTTTNAKSGFNNWFGLQLSLFWFGTSFLWSGLITIVVQSIVARLVPAQKDLYLGYTLALGALVSTLVCYYVGAHSDHAPSVYKARFGKRRPYILVGTLLSVPALLALSQANSIMALIVVICAIQFTVNMATAPYQALIPDLVPKAQQGAASAWMGMSSLLGTSLGLVFYNWAFSHASGLLLITLFVSALLLITMTLTLWQVHELPFESAASTCSDEDAPSEAITAENSFDWRSEWVNNRSFFWLIGSRFMINLGFYSATEFLLYYVTDTLRAPNPQATVAKFFLISTVAGLVGNFPAGIMADRVSKKLVVYVSLAITGVAALVFLLAHSVESATYAAYFFGAGFGAFTAVDWALATNLLPDRDEARWMGIWHGAFTVPQVVAPVVGGTVAHVINSAFGMGTGYRAVLFLVLVYLAIGALMIRPIQERSHAVEMR